MKLSNLPAEILNLVFEEAKLQGITIDLSTDPELQKETTLNWSETRQGFLFWRRINEGDFSGFNKGAKEQHPFLDVMALPIEIAKFAIEELKKIDLNPSEFDSSKWSSTEQGHDFWKKIYEEDFSEFFKLVHNTVTETTEKLVQEINNSQNQEIMQNVQNTSKNLPLVQQLQDLEATGKVRVIVRKEVRETHYKTRDLNAALEKQVVMNLIHTIPAMEVVTTFSEDEYENDGIAFTAGDSVEVSQPRVMIDILIIGLDNADTIQKKIDIAKGRLAELDRIDKIVSLRESDNLLDCLDGYFGEGNRIAIKEQSKNN